jgi:FKBP-type peptidyl-prolyl cis-trans isomerase
MTKKLFVLTIAFLVSLSFGFQVNGQTRRAKAVPHRHAVRKANRKFSPGVKSPAVATKTASGLIYLITRKGAGRFPKKGELVVVHYTGTLTNGVKFDSSRDRDEPFPFELGAGRVIKGWDEGIARLHVGDQAILVIPAQLGYGARGAGDGAIPPNATLIFIVELVEIRAKSPAK